jgi:hypothetical protein
LFQERQSPRYVHSFALLNAKLPLRFPRMGTMLLLARGFTYFGLFAGAYTSFKLVKSGLSDEDLQKSSSTLKFWVMYSMLIVFDGTIDPWISWFPFYDYGKFALVLYLLVPHSNGASILYDNFALPLIKKYEKEFETKHFPRVQGKALGIANKAQLWAIKTFVSSIESAELDALTRDTERSIELVLDEKLRRRRDQRKDCSSSNAE